MKIELKFGIREYVYIIFKQSNMLIKNVSFAKMVKSLDLIKLLLYVQYVTAVKRSSHLLYSTMFWKRHILRT